MEKGKHGLVNTATIASQLLYEIQGVSAVGLEQ